MRLQLVREPFDDPAYLFELKHHGFRAVCYIEDGTCRLVSRNLRNLRFGNLQKDLARLPAKDLVLDGEIICLDRNGVSQFNALLTHKAEPVFYAFDLLWLNSQDLMQRPLIERKARLCEFVQKSKCESLLYAQHIEEYGKKFFQEICRRDLEGIVAERKMSVYKPGGDAGSKSRTATTHKPRVAKSC